MGKNVVLCFPCSLKGTQPIKIHPTKKGNNDWKKWVDHDVFEDIGAALVSDNKPRHHFSLNQDHKKVSVLAKFVDGDPLLAVRYDLAGLLT